MVLCSQEAILYGTFLARFFQGKNQVVSILLSTFSPLDYAAVSRHGLEALVLEPLAYFQRLGSALRS
jgi:hypothetical protein